MVKLELQEHKLGATEYVAALSKSLTIRVGIQKSKNDMYIRILSSGDLEITGYSLRTSQEGKEFYALSLTGGIEIVKSANGSSYLTNKKASMPTTFDEELENTDAYQRYNSHSEHNFFIQEFWPKYVETFLEIDYERVANIVSRRR